MLSVLGLSLHFLSLFKYSAEYKAVNGEENQILFFVKFSPVDFISLLLGEVSGPLKASDGVGFFSAFLRSISQEVLADPMF